MGVHCDSCTCTGAHVYRVVGDWPTGVGNVVIATHRAQARRRLDAALRCRGLPTSKVKPYLIEQVGHEVETVRFEFAG